MDNELMLIYNDLFNKIKEGVVLSTEYIQELSSRYIEYIIYKDYLYLYVIIFFAGLIFSITIRIIYKNKFFNLLVGGMYDIDFMPIMLLLFTIFLLPMIIITCLLVSKLMDIKKDFLIPEIRIIEEIKSSNIL